MRSRLRRRVFLPALAMVLVTGCSAGSSSPHVVAKVSGLPVVVGAFGAKPQLTFPDAGAPGGLESRLLRTGTGRKVQNGDLLVVDYLGQVWNGRSFGNSYDRGFPDALVIGRGKAITGWDDVLVGVPVGSRVVMTVPPDKAYGAAGKPSAGIKPQDTLVFVVDVVAAYNRAARGDLQAHAQQVATPGIKITGPPGGIPVLTVVKGAKAPVKPAMFLLARGSGAPIRPGLVIVQYVAERYVGGTSRSTYARGVPAGVIVSGAAPPHLFSLLRGVPIGSRVLLTNPAAKGLPATAVVVDVIAEPTAADVHA